MITTLSESQIIKLLEVPQLALAFQAIGSNLYVCIKTQKLKSINICLGLDDTVTLDSFSKLLANFKGQVFVWDYKAFYKCLKSLNVNSAADSNMNILDVQLGVYLEDSSQSVDLVSAVGKIGIKLVAIDAAVSNNTADEGNLFEVETSFDNWEPLESQSEAILQLGCQYLKTFNEQTTYLWNYIESPLAAVLAQMELSGVYVDKQKLTEIAKELKLKIHELQTQIHTQLGNQQINLNSSQQLGQILIDKGYILKKKGKTGMSTNKQVLEELALTDTTGLINQILQLRSLAKLDSTYTDNLLQILDSESRIHCEFNQSQTATGRISSTNPNLQNIPIKNQEYGSQFRSCFAAPGSRYLISADYSQIELRLLAHFCQDENMIQAFQAGEDIHRRTAAAVYGLPIEEVTSKQRNLGKTLNFALVYQQGTFATARMLGITQKEGEEFINRYFASFPKVKPFIEQTLADAKENGFVTSLYGRRRYFKNLQSKVYLLRQLDERAAFNAVLQGSNADLIKIAMLQINAQIKSKNLDAQLVLQVHDELVLEVADKDKQEVEVMVRNIMANPGKKLLVPILVDTVVGKNWSAS